jgi:spore germination protein YaaH
MKKLFSARLYVFILIAIITLHACLPTLHAQTVPLEVSGWIPYWAANEGSRDARTHIETFDEINPFAFSVKDDGTLSDLAGLKKSTWQRLIRTARNEDVRVIPTVMWSNGQKIHAVLSNDAARQKHVDAIVSIVERGKYDGVDIDYEGKWAETRLYFSLFLLQLKVALGDKDLSCTIEARTPPESAFLKIPNPLEYANDLPSIGIVCDQVKIMAYDQQRIDFDLNGARMGAPYIPVSDPAWVRKVIALMSQSIPKNKIFLGIPTYGREWVVTVSPNQFKAYQNLQAVNPGKALEIASDYRMSPIRNGAGEVSFSFIPKGSPFEFLNAGLSTSRRSTNPGDTISSKALAYANTSGQTLKFNVVWWSDAEAIAQKVELAQELGLRGVAIFKIDGEQDNGIWDALK